jgi:hypothetical protein
VPDTPETAVRPDVRAFFDRYAHAGDRLDDTALTDSFHEVFLSLDPTAATPVPRAALLAALPRRKEMFESAGVGTMVLSTLGESPLDELHTLAHASWTAPVESGEPLTLSSTFLLRRDATGAPWRIVVYLNHQDVGELIRNRGAGGA